MLDEHAFDNSRAVTRHGSGTNIWYEFSQAAYRKALRDEGSVTVGDFIFGQNEAFAHEMSRYTIRDVVVDGKKKAVVYQQPYGEHSRPLLYADDDEACQEYMYQRARIAVARWSIEHWYDCPGIWDAGVSVLYGV